MESKLCMHTLSNPKKVDYEGNIIRFQRESCRAELQRQKEKRESTVSENEERGMQRATKGSAVYPHRVMQSSAGTAQRSTRRDAEGDRGSSGCQKIFERIQDFCIRCFLNESASVFLVKNSFVEE